MVNSHLNWLRFAIMLKGKLRKTAEQSRRERERERAGKSQLAMGENYGKTMQAFAHF